MNKNELEFIKGMLFIPFQMIICGFAGWYYVFCMFNYSFIPSMLFSLIPTYLLLIGFGL
jgi:hypothetical protein